MSFPVPRPGMVIRYAYLWRSEQARGLEEGSKDRPCAVLLAVAEGTGGPTVVVLPISHSPPRQGDEAVELPTATKRRLGLDDSRSWVVVTEANRFTWPGPDLRPLRAGDPGSILYGLLPAALYQEIKDRWLASRAASRVVHRSE